MKTGRWLREIKKLLKYVQEFFYDRCAADQFFTWARELSQHSAPELQQVPRYRLPVAVLDESWGKVDDEKNHGNDDQRKTESFYRNGKVTIGEDSHDQEEKTGSNEFQYINYR